MQEITLYVSGSRGNPKNTVYPTAVRISDTETFRDAVQYDHVCAKYKNDRRSESNFETSDCIAMDCDNDHSENPEDWKTPADVEKTFPNVTFMIAYSRNHMKEKNGRTARPKFHVYFLITPVSDAKLYVAMKQQILERFPQFDANAADAARFYFGTEDSKVEMHNSTKTVDMVLPKIIPEGSRNSTLHKKACSLIKRYGNTETAYTSFMTEAKKCVPPLEKDELEAIWNSATKFGENISKSDGYVPPEQYNPPKYVTEFLKAAQPERNRIYAWTDIGASRLFADCFKRIIRYVPERKCWYHFESGVWHEDVGALWAMELCKQLANALTVYALSIEDERQRQDYLKYCAGWQNRRTRETILKDAQGIHPIAMSEFDSDPYVFNCKNGTLHLDTMGFTPHNPDDKLTKISGVEYNPNAKCERFLTFVDEITSGDTEKAKFIQKVLGYGISGDTRYECLFILYGATTRNGKGTLCESVLNVLGSYGCTARPETISISHSKNSSNPTEDIARLAGIRFTNISEPGRGLILNAAQVKSMTGNDTLNARFLHENSFDFKPQFKLYINTNYLPVINDMTLFNSGRVVIIPFDRHFDESEQDKTLKSMFAKKKNQSAILNWLLEGYRLLRSEGLNPPASVKTATADYRHDSDKIMQFVEERLEEDPAKEVRTSMVYDAYRGWCDQNGCYAENSHNFNQALRGIADIVHKRPKTGGGATTLLIGYRIIGMAEAI